MIYLNRKAETQKTDFQAEQRLRLRATGAWKGTWGQRKIGGMLKGCIAWTISVQTCRHGLAKCYYSLTFYKWKPNRPMENVLGNIQQLDRNIHSCQRKVWLLILWPKSGSLCPRNGRAFLSKYGFLIKFQCQFLHMSRKEQTRSQGQHCGRNISPPIFLSGKWGS